MIPPSLLEILRCPLDGQPLALIAPQRLRWLQDQLAAGALRDHNDGRVDEPFDQALVTADGRRAYPVRSGIPTLIPSESIPLPAEPPPSAVV